jgi:hypothetical protein
MEVSPWRGEGHFQASGGSRERIAGGPDGGHNQAATADGGREAAACRRDVGRRCVGGESGAGAWGQRQPGVGRAHAVSCRATGRAGSDRALAGCGKRELAGAGAGPEACGFRLDFLVGGDPDRASPRASAHRGQRRSGLVAGVVGVPAGRIGPPTNPRVGIAAGGTDLRRGFTGRSARVQTKLEPSPCSGPVFVFRGRRGDLIEVLWYDGDGLWLFAKRLERAAYGRRRRAAAYRCRGRSYRGCEKALLGGTRSGRGIRSWRGR